MTGSISGQQAGHRGVDLVLVEVGDLCSMVSMAPVCSPTPIICTTIGGKTLGLLERLGDGLALLDRLAHVHDGVLDDRVAGGPGGDLEGVEDRHAGGEQGAERAGEARDGDLAQQRARGPAPSAASVSTTPPAAVGRVVALEGERSAATTPTTMNGSSADEPVARAR